MTAHATASAAPSASRLAVDTDAARASIIVVGIDPGLRHTGWGAIAIAGSRLSFCGAGTISSSSREDLSQRLAALHTGVCGVLDALAPQEVAIETTFVNRDGAATLKLGQARGVALLAPAMRGVPVAEYAPNLVKKSVVGAGHADKAQIRHMVGVILPGVRAAGRLSEHAFDGLAIAICHASHRRALRATRTAA